MKEFNDYIMIGVGIAASRGWIQRQDLSVFRYSKIPKGNVPCPFCSVYCISDAHCFVLWDYHYSYNTTIIPTQPRSISML